ncbi:MAG TPA: beta-ketoacyl-[acyl-carrier-protein] synthase family protein [Thermodesulfovibrionales bacterium]|nr:beta-ketoacyl-[acyl-carrier-protein] synthase family protein [Thermodesulfovibrionales bacterium]
MNERVVITGLGAISSIGIGWEEFWSNLLNGKSGISPVSSFDTTNHFTHHGGEVKNFRPEEFIPKERIRSLSRASQLALAAAQLAVEDANLSATKLSIMRAGACIGTTMGSVQAVEAIDEMIVAERNNDITGNMVRQVPTHSTPSVIAREFMLHGPNLMFSTACAAGNYAIGYAFDLIRFGRADIIITGGSDPLSRVAFTGFNQFSAVAPEKCQPFDKSRKGMMVAEGAGLVVLESLENAVRRDAKIYAEVLGYGLSCDAFHMTTSAENGIVECMKKAITETGIMAEQVDYISAHGTGTLTNDRNESAAIKEVFGSHYKKIPVSSIKSMLGHTMGAASALETIVCALAVKQDIIPPTINYETPDPECDSDCVPNRSRQHVVTIALNNSYAFGGNNACLVLRKFTDWARRGKNND